MSLALWGWRKIQLDDTGQCKEGFLEQEKFKQNFEVEVYGLEKKKQLMEQKNDEMNGL